MFFSVSLHSNTSFWHSLQTFVARTARCFHLVSRSFFLPYSGGGARRQKDGEERRETPGTRLRLFYESGFVQSLVFHNLRSKRNQFEVHIIVLYSDRKS